MSHGQNGNSPLKIVVGVPLERTLPSEAFGHFWEIARRGYALIHRPYARADVTRNEFGRTLLESDYTHLCMLDSDHLHPFDVVEKLARWAASDRGKYQVVAALCFRRAPPYEPCAYDFVDAERMAYPVEWQPGLMKAMDAVGHGAVLIAREVLERIPPPWWKYEYREWGAAYASEDLYFSRLCREAGVKLWVDFSLSSPHLESRGVDECNFRAQLAMEQT